MDTLCPDQMKLLGELLLKGKESATQLQTLLQKPLENNGSVSAAELAEQILRSFTDTLSELGPKETCQIVAANGMTRACSSDRSSQTTDRHRKKTRVKDRRGSYRRRNDADTLIKVTSTMEDEHAWRKYGQKDILHSKFPRCYFRCTHKYTQECKATKQVQRIKQDPLLFQTTYFGHHTCNDTMMRVPQIIQESDPMAGSYILSFETKMRSKQDSINSAIIGTPKEVIIKEDTHSNVSDNKSLLDSTLWKDLVTSGSSKPEKLMPSETESAQLEEVISSAHSCSSDTLHGWDMVAFSKFADFDNDFYLGESDSFLSSLTKVATFTPFD